MRKGKRPVLLTVSAATLLLSGTAALFAQANRVINIVAAENFYGSVAEQVGGDDVSVTSIISDPNVDHHEYEASAEDAKVVAAADLVIENGGGYDGWMDRLLSASPSGSRMVLKGFDLAVKKLPENEHIWYSVDNMQAIAIAVSRRLERLLPREAAVFSQNDRAFQESLGPIRQKMELIAARYAGTPVGLTEDTFLYQSVALGLKAMTPFELQKAVAEGREPPGDTAAEMENQIRQKKIRILICNDQTLSGIETKFQADARALNIPVVGMTETMPPGETYQTWMLRQLDEVRSALIAAGS